MFRAVFLRSTIRSYEWVIFLEVNNVMKGTTAIIETEGESPRVDKEDYTLKKLWTSYLTSLGYSADKIRQSFIRNS
jgi:hypothetical protein